MSVRLHLPLCELSSPAEILTELVWLPQWVNFYLNGVIVVGIIPVWSPIGHAGYVNLKCQAAEGTTQQC